MPEANDDVIAYPRGEEWPIEAATAFLRLPLAEQKDCAWDVLMLGTAFIDNSGEVPRRIDPMDVVIDIDDSGKAATARIRPAGSADSADHFADAMRVFNEATADDTPPPRDRWPY